MSSLAELKPTKKALVIDLVQSAGINTSAWGDYKGGPERAASNPKYCYEWAFIEEGKVVVLNLWYGDMEYSNGQIIHRLNFKERATRQHEAVWRKRDEKLEAVIRASIVQNLPIRVIIIDGPKRDTDDINSPSSSVDYRMLDPVCWTATQYDRETGECILKRGIVYVDQFNLIAPDSILEPTRRTTISNAFIRDAAIREFALQRAQGKCEWCNQSGFETTAGTIYLETHHIVPLSEGGPDCPTNVIALCPNHHREAHFGSAKTEMKDKLRAKLAKVTR